MPPVLPSETNPKLPAELLSHIFNYLQGNDFASLARCSRLFHQLYNHLLYRDLYIYTPRQLVRLLRKESAVPLLQNTESMFIDDWVLYSKSWDEIRAPLAILSPLGCLINLWEATPNLRRIQVCRSDLTRAGTTAEGAWIWDRPANQHRDVSKEWSKLTGGPTLVPRLAFVAIYMRGHRQFSHWNHDINPFVPLIRGRPGIYTSRVDDSDMVVKVNYRPQENPLENDSHFVSAGPEGFNGKTSHSKLVAFIESSLQVSSLMRTDPDRILLYFSNLGNSLNTQYVCCWLGDLMTELKPATTIPNLRYLMLRFQDLAVPNQPFKLEGQDAFFKLIDRVSPELTTVGFRFGRSSIWLRWFKMPLTLEERHARPTFPHWVPTFLYFLKDELYAWWIESLNLDADIVGTPNPDTIQSMALELDQAFKLAYRHEALDRGLIVLHLLEYYER